MRIPATRLVSVIMFGLIAITAPVDSRVTVEVTQADGIDWASLRTFAWHLPERDPGHPLAEGELIDRVIRTAIVFELRARGLEETNAGPDLWVTYDGALALNYQSEMLQFQYGAATYIGSPSVFATREIGNGSLVISLTSADSQEVVWSAYGSGQGKPASPEKVAKRVEKVTKKMLRDLPAELR